MSAADNFDVSLQKLGEQRGWTEQTLTYIRQRRGALSRNPVRIAQEIAKSLDLPHSAELALRQLGTDTPVMLITPPQSSAPKTTWQQDAPSTHDNAQPPQPPADDHPTSEPPTLFSLHKTEKTQALEAYLELARRVGRSHARRHAYGNLSPRAVRVSATGDLLLPSPSDPPSPAYTAPELLRESQRATLRSDVFSIGCALFELLGGVPLFAQVGDKATCEAVLSGSARPPKHPLSPEWETLIRTATATAPADRFPSAIELAAAIQSILKLPCSHHAPELYEAARSAWKHAKKLSHDAQTAILAIPRTAPVSDRVGPWRLQDEAKAAHEAALIAETLALDTALHEEESAIAASLYLRAHKRAERAHLPSAHLLDAIARHDHAHKHTEYLQDIGTLTLHSVPADATITVEHFEEQDHQAKLSPGPDLQSAPVEKHPLPAGSYVARLSAPDFHPARVPFVIRRRTHWHGTPPGASTSHPITLLPEGELASSEVYIPAGWFQCGAPTADSLPEAWTWVQSFVMQRYPVRVREYLEFLNALQRNGKIALAKKCACRRTEAGPNLLFRGSSFESMPNPSGITWKLSWPIAAVSVQAATHYARWRGALDGYTWRLPRELEWEKAARGVDGRVAPWGSGLERGLAHCHQAHPGAPRAHPTDTSPYGIVGLGGNTRDWVTEPYRPPPTPFAVARGGSWAEDASALRSSRRVILEDAGCPLTGFRLVRDLS